MLGNAGINLRSNESIQTLDWGKTSGRVSGCLTALGAEEESDLFMSSSTSAISSASHAKVRVVMSAGMQLPLTLLPTVEGLDLLVEALLLCCSRSPLSSPECPASPFLGILLCIGSSPQVQTPHSRQKEVKQKWWDRAHLSKTCMCFVNGLYLPTLPHPSACSEENVRLARWCGTVVEVEGGIRDMVSHTLAVALRETGVLLC